MDKSARASRKQVPVSPVDYDVGYKKPPSVTQFKKGNSGNPKGRPKGSVNLITSFQKALAEKVTVNVGGRRKTITKLDAAVTQLVNKAAGGDLKALHQLMACAPMFEIDAKGGAPRVDQELDRQVIQDLQRRMQEASHAAFPDATPTVAIEASHSKEN